MTLPLPQHDAWIGIGANLGDRALTIQRALETLDAHPEIAVRAAATCIETEAVGPGSQPNYLNTAAHLRTSLDARDLLNALLQVESVFGRNRELEERWGPRTLDLDILIHGDHVIDEPGLVVPHPRMHERDFVLQPLSEIAPEVHHPALGVSIAELLASLSAREP